MPKLLKTTTGSRGRGAHQHVAYVLDNGQGMTSNDKGHAHPIMRQMIPAVVPDPNTGMAVQVMQPGPIVVQEVQGHTHDLTDLQPVEKNPKGDELSIVNEVKRLFVAALDNEKEYHDKGEESEGFYDGSKQWILNGTDQRRDLEGKNRAALTINQIESKVDLLSGYQRQNRSDIKYLPVEGGNGKIADILNVVTKNIIDQNDYEFEETQAFDDCAITGRGNLNVYADYDTNVEGDIIVERFPWRKVWFGPHENPNCKDLEYLCKETWFSQAKLKQMWPGKASKIDAEYNLYLTGTGHEPHVNYTSDQYGNSSNLHEAPITTGQIQYDPNFVNLAKKEFRVVECWRKEYIKVPVVVDAQNNFYFNAKDFGTADVEAAKTIPGLAVVYQKDAKMRVTSVTGGTLLEDDYPDLPEQDFHIIPVYAKKRGKKIWGKVESVKDAQREVNKRHSQMADILNKVATYGYFYDNDTFPSQKEEGEWKKNSSTPGFNQKVSDAKRPPTPAEGVKFPTEIANFMTLENQTIREILNINVEMAGMTGGNVTSGVALVEQKRQGLIGNEFLFDNLNRAKKKLGKLLVKYIQKIYTPERILRVLQNRHASSPVTIGGQPLDQIDPNEILYLLKTADLTKYDVAVSMSSFNPTTRLANFLIWQDLAAKGVQVPPAFLLDLSDMPDKEKALKMFAQQQQQQQQQELGKQKTEIQKTMIAHATPAGAMGQ